MEEDDPVSSMVKINPMHPVRGTQSILAIIVLGLLAYGMSTVNSLVSRLTHRSLLVVDIALAPRDACPSRLPDIRISMVARHTRSCHPHTA